MASASGYSPTDPGRSTTASAGKVTRTVSAAYRARAEVESGFRQLKGRDLVSFSPMHHWTEQKIRVHGFYCVLAHTVAYLIRRQAEHAGPHLWYANCCTSWPPSKRPCSLPLHRRPS